MNDPDAHIRSAAFSAMERLVRYRPDGLVRWNAIHRGFQIGAEHIHFANRARGIFKPRQMSAALSIKTVVPRAGRPTWYSDQGVGFIKARCPDRFVALRFGARRTGRSHQPGVANGHVSRRATDLFHRSAGKNIPACIPGVGRRV